MDRIEIRDLFDLSHTQASEALSCFRYPWEALAGIGDMIRALTAALPKEEYDEPAPGVFVHRTARVAPTASLSGPCLIGPETEVRPGAFIRGNALVGAGAVVGNSCELKNCILFDGVQVPHFNYVGDSILGWRAHLGAGAVTSNVKGDRTDVVIHGEREYPTGRRKVGAMLGDGAEVGCNSVLNPGCVLGRGVRVYPLSSVRGVVPEGSIVKGERGVFPLRG